MPHHAMYRDRFATPDPVIQIDSYFKQLIDRTIGKHLKQNEFGQFLVTPVTHASDKLSIYYLADCLKEDNPKAAVYQAIDAFYNGLQEDYLSIHKEAIVKELQKEPEYRSLLKTTDVNVSQYLDNKLLFHPPYEHFLNQELELNLVLDFGEFRAERSGNYQDSFYYEPEFIKDDKLPGEETLYRISELQGVSRKEIDSAIENGTAYSDKHLSVLNKRAELEHFLNDAGRNKWNPHFHTGIYAEYKNARNNLSELGGHLQELRKELDVISNLNYIQYRDILQKNNPGERILTDEEFLFYRIDKKRELEDNLQKEGQVHKQALKQYRQNRKFQQLEQKETELIMLIGDEFAKMEAEPSYQREKFITSIIQESQNSSMIENNLTFCTKMSLKQVLELQDIINREMEFNQEEKPEHRAGRSFVELYKGIRAGLYDFKSGFGSSFGIRFLNDMQLPVNLIKTLHLEGTDGMSVANFYGQKEAMWNHSLKAIVERTPDQEKVKGLKQVKEEKTYTSVDDFIKNAERRKTVPKQKQTPVLSGYER